MTELSIFLAIEIQASARGRSDRKRFVRPIQVEGLPEDRIPRLLASMLSSRARLMQLLWLLLSPDDDLSLLNSTSSLATMMATLARVWRYLG